MYTTALKSTLIERLTACGLSRGASYNMFHYMERIERYSGVKYLLSVMKIHYITLLNEGKDVAVKQGPVKPLYKMFKYGSPKSQSRALRAFKLIGLFRAPEPTLSDYLEKSASLKKMLDPFHNRFFTTDNEVDRWESLTHAPYPLAGHSADLSTALPVTSSTVPLKAFGTKAKKGLTLTSGKGYTTLPHEVLLTAKSVPRLVKNNYTYCSERLGPYCPSANELDDLIASSKHDIVGRAVLLTKDRGLKLRLIASVLFPVQHLISPLHNLLKSFLKTHPSCFCFDPKAGVDTVAGWLNEGKSLSSLDLLDATDNVPLSLQVETLRKSLLGHPQEEELLKALKVFKEACPLKFETPFGTYVSWRKGSPMGMKGSYYLFTFYLISLFTSAGLRTHDFAVVGDDIVVDSRYESKVIRLLNNITSGINPAKSIFNSSEFAEFCGRCITSRGALHVYKASPEDLVSDPMGLMRQYGFSQAAKFSAYRELDVETLVSYKAKSWLSDNKLESTVKSLLGELTELQPPTTVGGLSPYQYFRLGYINFDIFVLITKMQVAISYGVEVTSAEKSVCYDRLNAALLDESNYYPIMRLRANFMRTDSMLLLVRKAITILNFKYESEYADTLPPTVYVPFIQVGKLSYIEQCNRLSARMPKAHAYTDELIKGLSVSETSVADLSPDYLTDIRKGNKPLEKLLDKHNIPKSFLDPDKVVPDVDVVQSIIVVAMQLSTYPLYLIYRYLLGGTESSYIRVVNKVSSFVYFLRGK